MARSSLLILLRVTNVDHPDSIQAPLTSSLVTEFAGVSESWYFKRYHDEFRYVIKRALE